MRNTFLRPLAAAAATLMILCPHSTRFPDHTGAAEVFAAATEEQRYDSTQWYLKARYLFEKRKDQDGAKRAIVKACELDPDNAEAFAYMYILRDRAGLAVPEKFAVVIPEYSGSSGAARRWYANAVEAFERRDYDGAVFCATTAARNDVGSQQISEMVNICKREQALVKLRSKLEGKFQSVEGFIGQAPASTEDAAPPGAEDETSEAALSLRTARALITAGKTSYDPDRFAEWLGFARYIYMTKKDARNAKIALDAALLFYSSSEVALSFKSDLEKKIREEDEKEALRQKGIREAEEREKRRRAEEEKDKRSVKIREIVIADDTKKKAEPVVPVITGDFSVEDFLEDTSSAELSRGTAEIAANRREYLPVAEIPLANDRRPSEERKKMVADVRAYVARHSKAAADFFGAGKIQESLLEYEKIYSRILELDPRDVKSLYNLVLIYKKLGEQKNAQETFVRLAKAINDTSARYSSSPHMVRICDFVDCTLKTSVVNAALFAYNKKSSSPMNRANFDISKLRELGYIVIADDEDRTITLELVDNTFMAKASAQVKYSMTGIKCRTGGKYGVGANGVVACSIHGDNALVLGGQDIDRVEN